MARLMVRFTDRTPCTEASELNVPSRTAISPKWNGVFDAVYDGAASDCASVYVLASKSNVASTSPSTAQENCA